MKGIDLIQTLTISKMYDMYKSRTSHKNIENEVRVVFYGRVSTEHESQLLEPLLFCKSHHPLTFQGRLADQEDERTCIVILLTGFHSKAQAR